jgi:hypothetical protein
MKLFLSLFFFIASLTTHAQKTCPSIDLELIPQRKIRNLIENLLGVNNIQTFSQLQATYHKGQDLDGYRLVQSEYYLRELPEEVWRTYQITSPAKSWNGSMVSFGLLISKWEDKVMYRNDKQFNGIDTGQVIFVNLRIMKGLYNLAVGLEIVNIDSTDRSITLSYLKGGKSRGEQTIYFVPTRNGHTEIIHQTAFKSDSFIRDRCLYPYFHRIAINEFHRNMKKSLRENRLLLSQKI